MLKNPPANAETWDQSLGWEDPGRRAGQPTPVFLPGESRGQRSLAGCILCSCTKSDTAEATEQAQRCSALPALLSKKKKESEEMAPFLKV